jgi:hypothetical protein
VRTRKAETGRIETDAVKEEIESEIVMVVTATVEIVETGKEATATVSTTNPVERADRETSTSILLLETDATGERGTKTITHLVVAHRLS